MHISLYSAIQHHSDYKEWYQCANDQCGVSPRVECWQCHCWWMPYCLKKELRDWTVWCSCARSCCYVDSSFNLPRKDLSASLRAGMVRYQSYFSQSMTSRMPRWESSAQDEKNAILNIAIIDIIDGINRNKPISNKRSINNDFGEVLQF